ncbi:hypothetical protein GUITHDRAFT_164357 [Guillardia theta CCMP2712]|uniref:Uncharacterized protein n=1 Tax=Guillardia theta (strain CCMP2712) TaxID=905079 RepID=L1IZD1_GUITC|nr:hypothetical protein GUITHDRAFT_164357 [Guillardia theta CCMP2712]EKX41437.1 hypothetical protein GUITHDRAFT_164357 [Guillardia theta CCMP2712]|eukprot:XP_005828417.1 hypothetical protein GUITHDRAFT_164357 [Guillardia theta CCMP2712]
MKGWKEALKPQYTGLLAGALAILVLLSVVNTRVERSELVDSHDLAKLAKWKRTAEDAAEKAESLDGIRKHDEEEADLIKVAEKEWLKREQFARQKIEQLKSRRASIRSLQRDERLIRRQLELNNEEIRHIRHEKDGSRSNSNAPKQQDSRHSSHSDSDENHLEKVLKAEEEKYHNALQRYNEKREVTHDSARDEKLEREIEQFRQARRALEGRAPVTEPLEKHIKHQTLLNAAETALGDQVVQPNKKNAAPKRHRLPGVNAYSWWSEKPEIIAAEKEKMTKQAAAQLRKHPQPVKDKNCHDLYSCVSSMFSGDKGHSKLSDANMAWKALRANHQVAQKQISLRAKPEGVASDVTVSRNQVIKNPQAPLLSFLQPEKQVHDNKLPGVVENRWGGTKFWNRLLGAPAKKTSVQEHHRKLE